MKIKIYKTNRKVPVSYWTVKLITYDGELGYASNYMDKPNVVDIIQDPDWVLINEEEDWEKLSETMLKKLKSLSERTSIWARIKRFIKEVYEA